MPEETAKHVEQATRPAAVVAEADETIKLSARDTEAFVQAVLEPWPVGQRLRETIRRYRTMTGA